MGNEGHFALEEVSGSRQSFDLEFALLQQFDDHLGVLSSALQELLLRFEIRNKWELAKRGREQVVILTDLGFERIQRAINCVDGCHFFKLG